MQIVSVAIIKKVIRIYKNREKITKTVSYKLQFIDGARFMTNSLLNIFDNLAEGIRNIKCKYEQDNKNVKCEELNKKILRAVLST